MSESAVSYGPMRQLMPSSRRSPLIVSEIMYHPSERADGKNLEFVELFNTEPVGWDISGFRLEGTIQYTFPVGTTLPGRSFVVVAADPASLQAEYSLTDVYGPYQSKLSDGGGTLRLVNDRGGVLLEIRYDDHYPWPESADGLGHSLVLTKPDYGENDPRSWQASIERGGNPGTPNSGTYPTICINEILANPATGQTAFIELYNSAHQPVSLSGCYLSDSPDTPKFRIPDPTLIAAGGCVSFSTADWGMEMSLSRTGERVYLLSADQQHVIDAVTYGAEAPGVSLGHFPNGAYGVRALAAPTPGQPNAGLYDRDVVINEIMYHPISEDGNDEYVELYNQGTQPVDVGGWQLDAGVTFTLPAGTVIPADGYLVVAADAARLIGHYAHLSAANTVGDFTGQLANEGECLRLLKPLSPTATDSEFVVIDEVTYDDGSDWGEWADGGGSSLELKDPHSDNSRPGNWTSSDETAKAPWKTFRYTGTLDLGTGTCNKFELLLLDSGQCLVDDIIITRGVESVNRANNGNFESALAGWTIEGNHAGSYPEIGAGFNGSTGMHVVATGGGDNLCNCLRQNLTSSLSQNSTATLSFKARWLCGHRNVLLRLHGNYLETVGTLDVPVDLGTPGRRNSVSTDNAGPVIEAVEHAPVLPQAGQAITITARVHDPDGVANVTLYYRPSTATSASSVAMNDSGLLGDTAAGDGVYTAVLSGRTAGTMVSFYVLAQDNAAAQAVTWFPAEAPDKKALIRVGDTVAPGLFGNYKVWVDAANGSSWSKQPKMSNALTDCTFVYGDVRAVYDAGIRMRGSGWIRARFGDPFTWIASYLIRVDKSDPVMGSTSLNLDNLQQQSVWNGSVVDPTFLRERMTYWIGERLGVETSYMRFILLHFNGVKKGVVFTDMQQPGGDYLTSWFPDDDNGHLFEVDDWFEYDNGFPSSKGRATLERFTTTGSVLKQARYRWNWEKKPAGATDDDYAPLFELVNTMNSGTDYYRSVDALVDWQQWMRALAIRRGAAADRDGYGYEAGKNAFVYKGLHNKWKYILWDLDLGFGIERDYNAGLFDEINDPVLKNKFFTEPAFRRAYWRNLQDLVDGPMLAANFDPVADAYYNALKSNGITINSHAEVKNWVRNRRGYIAGQLNSVAASFAVTTNSGNNFSTATSPYTLRGTAPVKVDAIHVNGVALPVTWTDVTSWSLDVTLTPGQNTLEFQGYDSRAQALAGMSDAITITCTKP